jgi:hypothetical protein
MKKGIFKKAAAVLLVCVMMCAIAACATKLSGTYTNDEGLIKQSFTFKDDNKVEVSAFGINVEGEYVIEKDEITITYSLFDLSYNWTKSFKMDENSIFINGVEFVKEKQ